MKNYYVAVFISLIVGFSTSTVIAFFNGYGPCVIYSYCEFDVVEENRNLIKEAESLRINIEKLDDINKDALETLKRNLESQKQITDILSNGFLDIASINKKGMNNEQKIREIAKTVKSVGVYLSDTALR